IQVFSLLIGLFFSRPIFNFVTSFLSFYSEFELQEEGLGMIANIIILNLSFYFIKNVVTVKDKWFVLFFCYIVFTNLFVFLPFSHRVMMYVGIGLTVFFANFIVNNNLGLRYRPIVILLLVVYCI